MKIKNIYEPVFKTSLKLIYDCSPGSAEEYIKKYYKRNDLLTDCCAETLPITVTFKDNTTAERYLIYIKKGAETFDTIVHELSHLVFYALDSCGIKTKSGEESETYAYYLEWWVNTVSKILKLHK